VYYAAKIRGFHGPENPTVYFSLTDLNGRKALLEIHAHLLSS
jgi:hypothetical protein